MSLPARAAALGHLSDLPAGSSTTGNKLTGGLLFIAPLPVLYRQIPFLYLVYAVGLLSALEEMAIHLTSVTLNLNRRRILAE